MNTLAPIVVFTYNRLTETIQTIEALQRNYLAKESELFIFSDGAKNIEGRVKVEAVRAYLKTIQGFNSIQIKESPNNKGLANSIIDGVTEIIEEYGQVIVLEDDLVTSPNFLDFMNQALDYYKNTPDVISISGYTLDLPSLPKCNKDFYIGLRASSLGWGTWIDKWGNIDWDVEDYSNFRQDYRKRLKFFKIGSDMPGMLKRQMSNKIDSWAIRWCYHQFKYNFITVFASKSKVNHIGDGEDATNAVGATKFHTPIDTGSQRTFKFDRNKKIDKKILKEFSDKFSLTTRALGKLNRLFNS